MSRKDREYGWTQCPNPTWAEVREERKIAQNGKCGICGVLLEGQQSNLDHNHKTKQIRGVLCQLCNRGLGYFRDDPVALLKAIHYLKRWSEITSGSLYAPPTKKRKEQSFTSEERVCRLP